VFGGVGEVLEFIGVALTVVQLLPTAAMCRMVAPKERCDRWSVPLMIRFGQPGNQALPIKVVTTDEYIGKSDTGKVHLESFVPFPHITDSIQKVASICREFFMDSTPR